MQKRVLNRITGRVRQVRFLSLLPLLVWLGLGSGLAEAWGPEGHALVADMAEAHLTAQARAQVRALLALEGHRNLDQISSWPDAIRAAQPETGPWHYVDIPLYAAAYDEERDCHYDAHNNRVPELTCVVARLPWFAHRLADRSLAAEQRLEALKWVVHLTADLHQPLHAEDDHDRGGNEVHLLYYGKNTNLHAVWDLGVIEHQYAWQLGPDYSFDHDAVRAVASQMDQSISQQDRLRWASPRSLANVAQFSVQWANASHALALAAYRNLPADPQAAGWEPAYQAYAWPVIRLQLDRASVRLAALLNEALS